MADGFLLIRTGTDPPNRFLARKGKNFGPSVRLIGELADEFEPADQRCTQVPGQGRRVRPVTAEEDPARGMSKRVASNFWCRIPDPEGRRSGSGDALYAA